MNSQVVPILKAINQEAEKEKRQKMSGYEDAILELIDNRDEFTRSDLQGVVSALVNKIANNL